MSRRACAALVLVFLLLLGAASHAASSGTSFAPVAVASLPDSITIHGNPLQVVVGADSSIQVYHSSWAGIGQVYGWGDESADSGIWLWVGDDIYGPDFCYEERLETALNTAYPWTIVSHSGPSGSGTATDPWVVTTVLDAGTLGIRVTQRVSYVNGQDYFGLQWDVANSSTSSQTVDLFHALDTYFADDDYGVGYYDPPSGAVGSFDEAGPWYVLLVPVTAATAYQEGWYYDIWNAIGYCGDNVSCPVSGPCERGPGFDDTLNTDPEGTDDGFGLQWQRTVAAGGSVTLSDWWTFGAEPNIPGQEPATPTPTATPSQTRTATRTASPTSTPTGPVTPTPTLTPSHTSTHTVTPTGVASPTSTLTPLPTPTSTLTPTGVASPTPTLTATRTRTHTPTPTATVTQVCPPIAPQEAEDGIIQEPMAIVGDPTASGGWYVYTPLSYWGYVGLTFFVAEEADYYVWGRVSADSYGSDSFWVHVDDWPEATWDIPIGPWVWARVTHREATEPPVVQEYHLEPGFHQIRILGREAGARLDVVELRCVGAPAPTDTPTTTPTATPTWTPTPSHTLTPTERHTSTQTPTTTATETPTPTPSSTLSATPTTTPTHTLTSSPIATPTPTHTLTPTPTATPALPYDMDGDCDVDIVDIMLVAGRWGSVLGDARYELRYDLDHDGDIDIVDIMLVAGHWGEVCAGGA